MRAIEPFVRAIVGALMLLENSDESEIDPDTAVRGMEHIAHALSRLDAEGLSEFHVGSRWRAWSEEATPRNDARG